MTIVNIVSNVYVSDYMSALKYHHLFDLVVNCTSDLRNVREDNLITIPIEDKKDENTNILSYWKIYIPIIDGFVTNNKSVLIHCKAGVSRSVSTSIALLLYKREYPTIDNAIAYVKQKKSDAFMYNNIIFYEALNKYNKEINDEECYN